MGNAFEKYETVKTSATAKAKSIVSDFFPYIILVVNVAFLIVSQLYDLGIQNPFTPRFFINLSINVLSSTLCYACFVIYADTNARATNKAFFENKELWEESSTRLRMGSLFDKFAEYCKRMTEEEKEEKRLAIVMDNTSLSKARWDEIKNKRKKEIIEIYKSGEITKSELRYVLKAKGKIKIRPINPLVVLCGVRTKTINDAGRENTASVFKSIISRPFTMLLSSTLIAMIKPLYSGLSGGGAIFSMFCSIILIIVSAFLGYSKGVSNMEKAKEAIKIRIVFIERFEKTIKEQ